MCRLLYINSKQEFLIEEYLRSFADAARTSPEYQGDGWGIAFLQNSRWKHYKNIKPIWEDDLAQFGKTNRLITHARSAFKNEGISIENNMPFYDDRYIFVFNGELRGVKVKEQGRIGAEKIFNFIKRFDKGNIFSAIAKATEILSKKSTYVKAMNFVITDENAAYVYSQHNENKNYFTLHKKINNSIIIVCSTPLTEEAEWEKINNNSLTEFRCF